MFTFAEVKERREREKKRKLSWERKKNLGIGQVFFGETEKSFREKSFQEFSREISRAPVQRELEGERGISSTKEERSPHMFYQGTLWYRRRFKGDSTMFTECRGPRQIDGGREGRAERCIEACMPLVGLSCKPPFLEPALLRHSTLLYIPFDEHPLPRHL